MKKSNQENANILSVCNRIIVSIFVSIVVFGCKKKDETQKDANLEVPVMEASTTESLISDSELEMGCYMYKRADNMINFEITKNQNPIEGNLTYALAQKDKNVGTFKGNIKDNKLVGIYTFSSEGVESKRQVAFLLKDKRLVQGDGELNADGNMFLDVSTVSYSSEMPLNKTDCLQ